MILVVLAFAAAALLILGLVFCIVLWVLSIVRHGIAPTDKVLWPNMTKEERERLL